MLGPCRIGLAGLVVFVVYDGFIIRGLAALVGQAAPRPHGPAVWTWSVLEHRALEDKYNTFVLLEQQISELEAVSAEAGFWDDNVVASQKLQQVNDFKTSRSAKRRICRGAGFSSWVDHGGARGQAALPCGVGVRKMSAGNICLRGGQGVTKRRSQPPDQAPTDMRSVRARGGRRATTRGSASRARAAGRGRRARGKTLPEAPAPQQPSGDEPSADDPALQASADGGLCASWAEGLLEEAVVLKEQVRAALAHMAASSAGGGAAGGGAGGAGGDGGAGGYDSGCAVVATEVSETTPDVVRAVETALRVRSTAPGARRASIRVCQGEFAWRGVLPLAAVQEHTPDDLRPAVVLLHIASTQPAPAAARGAARGGAKASGAQAGIGVSAGTAALHGAWLMPQHSLGCFENVALTSAAPTTSTSADPTLVRDWESDSDSAYSGIESGELKFAREGINRGFWDRGKGGEGEEDEAWAGLADDGVPGAGVLRVGLRVLGGPWAFVHCDLLSERGVPLMLDDNTSDDNTSPGDIPLPPWLDQDRSQAREESGTAGFAGLDGVAGFLGRDLTSGRVLAVKCRVGGSLVDSWPMRHDAVADGGLGVGAGDDVEWGGEGAEAHGDRGACISGIHVCGHGTLSLQDTLVAACSNAGLVVSEKGSAVVTSSTLERPLISNVFLFFFDR